MFPTIHAGGVVLGAEYGHGILRTSGAFDVWYNATTRSVGAQLGFESKG
jgi:lipid-binding SYLF domain-containing protein